MSTISFFCLFITMLLIDIVFILNKKLNFLDFVIILSLMSSIGILNSLLSEQFQLYYYVSKNLTHVYFVLYDIVVYPTFAILFTQFLLIKKAKVYIIIYNITWICFMTLFELLIIKPMGIIVYTGWRIIPYSPIFYMVSYPLVTLYYIKLRKILLP